jgi:serine O-acetyltransferase
MTLYNLIELIKSDLYRIENFKSNNYYLLKILIVFKPKFLPILLIRLSRFFFLKKYLVFLSHLLNFLNLTLFGIDYTAKCNIGYGLQIPHPHGTVIGAISVGNNVTIFQGVTIGCKFVDYNFTLTARPRIGNNVILGAGAVVLGGISIGDSSTIAPNSLVLEDVKENLVMMGVPAVIYSLNLK